MNKIPVTEQRTICGPKGCSVLDWDFGQERSLWDSLADKPRFGMSLIELLGVTLIVGILSSLLLPVIFRVYERIKGTSEEIEAPEVSFLLLSGVQNYCAVHPQYSFANKADFADKCGLAPKCRDWVQATSTDFVAFTYLDDTNRLVLTVRIGRRHRTV